MVEDMKNYKIVVYATTQHGEGFVRKIGEYEDVEEMDDIHIGMFDKDVVIGFGLEKIGKNI